jgi:hypothetical protein
MRRGFDLQLQDGHLVSVEWRTAVCDILDLGTYCTCTSARVSSIMHGTLLLSSGSVVDRVFPCHIALYAGDHIALGCAATT